MTVWGDDVEKTSKLQNNVQIEIGVDETDLWLTFNKHTTAVVMTRAEAEQLVVELRYALDEQMFKGSVEE
jgi:hypothetical protein